MPCLCPCGPQDPEAPPRTQTPRHLFTASSDKPSQPLRLWWPHRGPLVPSGPSEPVSSIATAHPPRGQSQTKHCLWGSGSQLRVILSPEGLTLPGDISVVTAGRGGCDWHPAGRGQRCCSTSCQVRDSPNVSSGPSGPNVSCARREIRL